MSTVLSQLEMVQVTDGRTYMIKALELHPDIKCGVRKPRGTYGSGDPRWSWGARSEDFIVVETPIVVPNGKWVIEPTNAGLRQAIGVGYDEIEQITLDTTQPLGVPGRTLWISDKPFGTVCCGYEDDPVFGWTGPAEKRTRYIISAESMYFHSARQIHKGELGRSVPVPRLGRYGSVAWGEIADALGLMPIESLYGFWPFISWSTREELKAQIPTGLLAEYRVRRGLAHAILRLNALGFTPELIPA